MLLTKNMLLRSLESCPAGTRELVSAAVGDIVGGRKKRRDRLSHYLRALPDRERAPAGKGNCFIKRKTEKTWTAGLAS